ncbi:hypothetical protein D0T49_03080 [Paludibacter sp. 221]|nr:hypothetical protein [Paludibacter sp. 221]
MNEKTKTLQSALKSGYYRFFHSENIEDDRVRVILRRNFHPLYLPKELIFTYTELYLKRNYPEFVPDVLKK